MSRMRFYRLGLLVLLLATMLVTGYSDSGVQPVAAQSATPPQQLLTDQVLSDWTAAGPRVIWLRYPDCTAPGGAAAPVVMVRIKNTGGFARSIYLRNDPRAPGACNTYRLNSNIVADERYIYWVDGTQLVRLSVEANPGDTPEPWGPTFFNDTVELSLAHGQIIALQQQDCQFCLFGTGFELIATADGSSVRRLLLNEFGTMPRFDGKYIYYKDANTALRRFTAGSTETPITIVGKISEYVVEGEQSICFQITCTTTSYVYYIQTVGNNSIVRYNNIDGLYQLMYLPQLPGGQLGRLYGLALANRFILGNQSLFFFEQRYIPCAIPPGCFVTAATDLLRVVNSGGGAPLDLYSRFTDTDHRAQNVQSDGYNLYWAEQTINGPLSPATLKRLPANAEALPKVNLTVTGLEITQGIQRSDNTVPLIRLRPTFVRVFARATGTSVTDVTAHLQVSAAGSAPPR